MHGKAENDDDEKKAADRTRLEQLLDGERTCESERTFEREKYGDPERGCAHRLLKVQTVLAEIRGLERVEEKVEPRVPETREKRISVSLVLRVHGIDIESVTMRSQNERFNMARVSV